MTDLTMARPGGGRGLPKLGLGEFYGERRERLSGAGFELLRLRDRGEPVPRHAHEPPHLCIVLDRPYQSSLSGRLTRCAPMTLLYHPPGTEHRDHFLAPGGSCLIFSIDAARASELEESLRLPDHSTMHGGAEISRIARSGLRELRDPDGHSAIAVEGLALQLLAQVGRGAGLRHSSPPRWLLAARRALEDSSTRGITVASVAREAGVHPVHLARAFRRHFGDSPAELLRRRRLEAAMRLVAGPDLSLAEAALACGYCDQSELTKAFRRMLGTTPGRYRASLDRGWSATKDVGDPQDVSKARDVS